jgi:hypothetical protein
MKKFSPLLFVFLVMLALAGGVNAQDTTTPPPHPLLELLALVPDVPNALENVPAISFVDFTAMEAARPGVPVYASVDAFAAARAAGDEAVRIWQANLQRLVAAPAGLTRAAMSEEGSMRDVVGFDLFDVDQALSYGIPPSTANILLGQFDPLAVVNAFEARGYAVTQDRGIVTLQRADGKPGNTMDVAGRDMANPFGGEFGRQEPIVLAEGLILNSPDEQTLSQLAETVTGERRSLISRPSIAAAAEALTTRDATLLQAAFLDPRQVAVAPVGMAVFEQMLEATPDVESIQAAMEPQIAPGYGSLPFYTMAVMADMQRGDEQLATIALVYDDEEAARQAADELVTRLGLFRDTIRLRDDMALVERIEGAYVSPGVVYHSESTGKYVATASVVYPMPDNTLYDMFTNEPAAPEATSTYYLPSGRVIRYWVSSLYARAFDVLYVTE